MGNWISSIGGHLGKIANTTKKIVQIKLEERKHRSQLKEFKRQIIVQLETKELHRILEYYHISKINPLDKIDGQFSDLSHAANHKNRLRKTKIDREYLIKRVFTNIMQIDLIDWCRENRIFRVEPTILKRQNYILQNNIDDYGVKNTSTSESSKRIEITLIDDLLNKLQKLPRRRFTNEERAHYYLMAKLEEWFPDLRLTDEAHGKEVDILIGDKIAIEIKNFTEESVESEFTRLIGQTTRHSQKYDYYVVIIFGGNLAQKEEIESRLPEGVTNVRVIVK